MGDRMTTEGRKVDPWEAVYYTLLRSMGGWINQDRLRLAAQDILVALGYEDAPGYPKTDDMPGPDAPLVNAIKDLLDFAPEFGWTEDVAELVARSHWGDTKDPVRQARALNDREAWRAEEEGRPVMEEFMGERTGRTYRRRVVPDTGPVPLLSEALYYPLIGNKDNARTLRAYINEVRRLAGLEEEA